MHGRLGSKGRCVSDAGDDKDLGFFCFRVLSHLNLMTVLFDGCYYKSYCMKSDSESLEKVINCFMFGSAGSLLLHRLFSSCGEQRRLSSCGKQASLDRGGFSCCTAPAPGASVVVVRGLSSCSSQALSSIDVACRLSCPVACLILPDQGLNPCLLHWAIAHATLFKILYKKLHLLHPIFFLFLHKPFSTSPAYLAPASNSQPSDPLQSSDLLNLT